MTEQNTELAALEADAKAYPTLGADEFVDFPLALEKFGSYANYDEHCRARSRRMRELRRAGATAGLGTWR